MNFLKSGIAAALLVGPCLAFAATPGYLDGYYTADSKLKVHVPGAGSGDDSGDGYGLRVAAPIGDTLFVAAEYQTANLDDSDTDIDQIRAGLGFMMGEQLRFGGLAEYVHLKLDAGGGDSSTPDGYGLHGRIEFAPLPAATLYGQLGYVRVSDHGSADGLEWQVGAAYNFTPMFGAFADYRSTDLKDSDNVDIKLDDVRLGLRWNFGAM
ncbi:porin [Solimonas terrae]|uniref:Porin family protein n=1 Tax=Solimonas terrae TaxID=1396819 RepID=A0A6M2BS06_9GAMM|nr:porin [Solimonas terrae]NGY04777.1 porin family protein [Solimonas terrae]